MAINNNGQEVVSGYDKCNNKKEILRANNAVTLLIANPKREYASFVVNSSGEVTLVLGEPTSGKIGEGIPLIGKGNSYEINKDNPYKGRISAISAGPVELAIVECEKS